MSESKKIPFFVAFSAYIPNIPQLCARLAECYVLHITPEGQSGSIQVTIEADPPLSPAECQTIENELSVIYGGAVHIDQPIPTISTDTQVALSGERDPAVLVELLRKEMGKAFAPARGLLAGATGELNGETFTVTLLNGCHELLEAHTQTALKSLQSAIGHPVRLRFTSLTAAKAQKTDKTALLDEAENQRLTAMKAKRAAPPKAQKGKSDTMFGKVSMKHPTPMSELTLDMGMVLVEGDVFSIDHKDLRNRTDKVIRFDLTDYISSIRVTQFMGESEYKPILKNLKLGQHLLVQGRLTMDRFENDMVLQPTGIAYGEKTVRRDVAEGEKRVELHLHTRMSAMDALTDTGAVVKRALSWGHRAIAITDHGVAQSFPDAWHSAKNIKILYGVEAYFVNDVDDRVVVHGTPDGDLDSEIVCFDLETTGLDKRREVIIEIGAVLLKNGEVTDRFNTFVSPGRILDPQIIRLTGITDEMLEGAPSQKEALEAFLAFAGDRPLAAHNAEFDMGFVSEGCRKFGIPFKNPSVDSLILAQNLLPELTKFKLDIVAEHLDLPAFNHHRASDDAATVAYMLPHFWKRLREIGVDRLDQINMAMINLRGKGKAKRQPRHLIVLAKNQMGLRNLYKLVSVAHLEHFKRVPIMPKSVINANREGLILGSACEAGELFQAVVKGKNWDELKRIASWYDYLEIQPLCNNWFMLRKGLVRSEEELREFNRIIVRLGKELGKPVCATGDVHFLDPEDEIYRHILLASKGFEDADEALPIYFKTTQEMLDEFAYLGKETAYEVVVRNTNMIADWCDPIDPLPKGLFSPKLEDSDGELKRLVWGKCCDLYGENPCGGPDQRGAGGYHWLPLRRDLYVRPEAGPKLPGARLSGGLPGFGGLLPCGLHVRHHGGKLPAGPLPLSQLQAL